ncbi:MAG: clostripain-related cysteine peptidase [Pyrinomonadaceae bacterium]
MSRINLPLEDKQRKWTVMVYMVGDDELADNCIDDIKEMKQRDVGPEEEVTVVVQFDRGGRNGLTKRYIINRNGLRDFDGILSEDVDPDQEEEDKDMGDTQVLEDFITWAADNYPADHFMLVLWGHGSGVDDEFRVAEDTVQIDTAQGKQKKAGGTVQFKQRKSPALFKAGVKGIAFEENKPQFQDFLDNQKLQQVLAKVMGNKNIQNSKEGKIAILGMDACLMSMAEICYQMRDVVSYTVASEGLVPFYSWPYNRILRKLTSDTSIEPCKLASEIVDKFIYFYQDYDSSSVTHSACDLSQHETLVKVINGLADALMANISDKKEVRIAVMLARLRAQSYFDSEQYIDIYDFCQLLSEYCTEGAIVSACGNLISEFDNRAGNNFIINSKFLGSDVAHSHGLTVYFPLDDVGLSHYKELDFSKDAKWNDFINMYVEVARRTESAKPHKQTQHEPPHQPPYDGRRHRQDWKRSAKKV